MENNVRKLRDEVILLCAELSNSTLKNIWVDRANWVLKEYESGKVDEAKTVSYLNRLADNAVSESKKEERYGYI
jgi:hypothetical protein